MQALRTLVAHVQDLVLDSTDEPSSLAASLSMVVELFEGRIDVEALLHFPELKSELVLLKSGRNCDILPLSKDGQS
jgi:hypothetical protein